MNFLNKNEVFLYLISVARFFLNFEYFGVLKTSGGSIKSPSEGGGVAEN